MPWTAMNDYGLPFSIKDLATANNGRREWSLGYQGSIYTYSLGWAHH